MTATFVNFSHATFLAATSVTATVPTGVQVGDIMIAIICKSAAGTQTVPGTWIAVTVDTTWKTGGINATVVSFSSSAPTGGAGFYYRVADSSDTSTPTYTWTVSLCNATSSILVFRNVNPFLLGGAVTASFLFDSNRGVTRNASSIDSTVLGTANLTGDKTVLVVALVQLVTAATPVLSSPTGGYTEVANSSLLGVAVSIGYELVDLSTNPSVGVKSVATDTASGNGAGFVLAIADRTGAMFSQLVQSTAGNASAGTARGKNSMTYYVVQQNVAGNVPVYVTRDDGVTPLTGLASGDFTVKKLGKHNGTFNTFTPTITERGNGWYNVPLSSGDDDTLGMSTVHLEATGAVNVDVSFQVVAYDPLVTTGAAVWDTTRSGHATAGTFGEGVASVQGNVTGSVGSVVGAVGSVTGNVGGSVASVVGNVGGNVAGSVDSVVNGVGGNVAGSVGSVVGDVGGDVLGSAGTVDAATIAAAVADQALAGHTTAGTVGAALNNIITPAAIAAAVLNAARSGHVTLGTVGEGIALATSLLQGNFYMDNTNNTNPNGQTAARIRCFHDGTAAGAASPGGTGEGEFATFVVTTTYSGPNQVVTHAVVQQ